MKSAGNWEKQLGILNPVENSFWKFNSIFLCQNRCPTEAREVCECCSGRPDESKVMSVQVTSVKGLPGPDADGHKGREDGSAGTQRAQPGRELHLGTARPV